MNKSELISEVMVEAEVTKKVATAVIDAMGNAVAAALVRGDSAHLPGIGRIDPKKRKARPGRNPATGETFMIPEKNATKFVAAKSLTDAINA